MSGDRFSRIKRVLGIALFFNWLVALGKLVVGWQTHSASIFADGIHSVADGASNIVGLIGITVASQPADEGHPYGHRKFETLAAQFISIGLLFVCYEILRSTIGRMQGIQTPEVTPMSFAVMIVTMAVNTGVALYERRQGRNLGSDLLLADAFQTKADIFISAGVLVFLWAVKAGYTQLDSLAAGGIALFIAWNAVRMLLQNSDVLADKAVLDSKEIERIVMQIPEIHTCHEIRTRGRADDIHIDLHILVEDQMSIERAHHKSFIIEEKLKQHFRGVTDVVVHIEPVSHIHHLPEGT